VAALFVVALCCLCLLHLLFSSVLPYLTQAQAELTRHIDVVNEHGVREQASIPAERALTVYVDKREIVTLMTLGAHPELLVLGYLRNQRLVGQVSEVESITVDWDAGEDGAGVAAVKTRHGIADIAARTENVWSPPAAGRAVCLAI